MGFLAMILGPLMRMLYQMIPNFAVTMIVFTVIIKLLMLPLMIKQQKSMAKMSVFTPMINEIQQKYKNNQEKMQEEMVKLQQEYGYSPTAGCLPMLVNMLVLFGMVEVVYRPVQYGMPCQIRLHFPPHAFLFRLRREPPLRSPDSRSLLQLLFLLLHHKSLPGFPE